MLTVGITGGLGSGKSTACRFFEELGAKIFDADLEAKKILFSSNEVKTALTEKFGATILSDGTLDKSKLSQVVFRTPENQGYLNQLLHPLVTEEFLRRKSMVTAPVFIMDAALLFEAQLQRHFDKIILIYTDKEIRLNRALRRGNLSREQILSRMALQMDEERKKALADIVITNNDGKEDLKNKIKGCFRKLIKSMES